MLMRVVITAASLMNENRLFEHVVFVSEKRRQRPRVIVSPGAAQETTRMPLVKTPALFLSHLEEDEEEC